MYALLAVLIAIACARGPARQETARMPAKSIQDALAAHNDSLMAMPGVVGTAIGLCNRAPCIRVFVVDSAAASRLGLAPTLDGYPVRVEVSGPFRARPPDQR